MKNEMNLKDMVFGRAQAELEAFQQMQESGSCYTKSEKEVQLQRFCTAFQIIEEAGLEREYEFWCRMNA